MCVHPGPSGASRPQLHMRSDTRHSEGPLRGPNALPMGEPDQCPQLSNGDILFERVALLCKNNQRELFFFFFFLLFVGIDYFSFSFFSYFFGP